MFPSSFLHVTFHANHIMLFSLKISGPDSQLNWNQWSGADLHKLWVLFMIFIYPIKVVKKTHNNNRTTKTRKKGYFLKIYFFLFALK